MTGNFATGMSTRLATVLWFALYSGCFAPRRTALRSVTGSFATTEWAR